MTGTRRSEHPAGAQSMLRSLNERAVLELIEREGPLTRADVSARTGLSKPTVSAALGSLTERGAVREDGHVVGRKGPTAVLYALEPTCAWAVGVDIGHARIRVAVSDASRVVRGRAAGTTPGDIPALVDVVTRLCSEAAAEAAIALTDVTRFVIGVPAVVGSDGRELTYAEGLPAAGRGVGPALVDALPAPVTLENDVNLAALAELAGGVGVDDFLLVSLGTGLGVGVVINRRLHRGAGGAAGEAGYLPGPHGTATAAIPPLRRDMLEATIGARYISVRGRALGLGDRTPKEIFELARAADPAALSIVDDTAGAIAYVVACAAPLLDPELVVLGGAIGANDDLLLDRVREHLAGLSPFRPRLVTSELGPDAVLLGATATAGDLARATAFTAMTSASDTPAPAVPVTQHVF